MQSPDGLAGEAEKCPACGKRVLVPQAGEIVAPPESVVDQTISPSAGKSPNNVPPDPPAIIHFQCGNCDEPISVEEEYAGVKYKCPNCGDSGFVSGEIGIGGWLILVAINLFMGSVVWICLLAFAVLNCYFVEGEKRSFSITWFVLYLPYICFLVYVAVIFFRQKKHTPICCIALLCAIVVLSFMEYFVPGVSGLRIFGVRGIFVCIVAAAIGIPYFKVSKRVKATFVH